MNRKQRRKQEKEFRKALKNLNNSFEDKDFNWFASLQHADDNEQWEAIILKTYGLKEMPAPLNRVIAPSFKLKEKIDENE